MKIKSKGTGLFFGLLVVGAGVLLLLFDAGMLPGTYKSIVFSWQMLLIGMGSIMLFSRHKFLPGSILILLGAFFLLPRLDIDGLAFLKGNSWAVLLIMAGCIIIGQLIFGEKWSSRHCEQQRKHFEQKARAHEHHFNHHAHDHEAGYIERTYLFGGNKEKVDTHEFKGGDINCIFGGYELDLSNAQLADGVNTLEVNALFGGITLYLPRHWPVEIRGSQVFGHFADKREQPSFEVNENKMLIVKASAIFGGGEIRSR